MTSPLRRIVLALLVLCTQDVAGFGVSNVVGGLTSRASTKLFFDGTKLSSLRSEPSCTVLTAKKKRRRKKAPSPDRSPVSVEDVGFSQSADIGKDEVLDKDALRDVAKFEFKGDITKGVSNDVVDSQDPSAVLKLPDIKESKRRKELQAELERLEEEKEEKRPRIKRTDKEAFRQLLERQPFADADASYFVEEEYDIVAAVLGERAEKFLGIPTGPLQVAHAIGALVIVLMAFVEYPGFPLTNLPTPIRSALQGGLFSVYSINTLLSIASAFAARERGQPVAFWSARTVAVGALAFDQLRQLPTKEETARAKAVKGKRALKKR